MSEHPTNEECAAFPNAAHDGMVDAWGQAACRFRTSSSGIVDYCKNEAIATGEGNTTAESVALVN